MVTDRQWLAEQVPEASGLHIPTQNEPYAVSVVDDAVVSHVVVDEMAGKRMTWALAAHRTQVTLFDGYYSLSNDIAARLSGREAFARLDPATGERLPRTSDTWFEGLLVDLP